MRLGLQFVFVCLAGVSQASTYYVSPTGNNLDTGLSLSHAFQTIGYAVSVAPAGSLIELTPGTYIGTGNVDLTINQNLSFSAIGSSANTIWDLGGPASHRALIVNSGVKLALSGIHFQNGQSPIGQRGGVIDALGSNTLTITGCAFKNNKSVAGSGGAIYMQSGTLNLSNCELASNVSEVGGAIDFAGTLNASSCTFSHNTGNIQAGTIEVESNSNCNFLNTSFHHNTAPSGTTVDCIHSNATFQNCSIAHEDVTNSSGAIYGDRYSVIKCYNTSFSENFGSGSVAVVPGGTFIGCRFTGNQTHDVILSYYSSLVLGKGFFLGNDLFANNQVGTVIQNSGDLLDMRFCTVSENVCSGAALINDTTANLSSCIFWNNGGVSYSTTSGGNTVVSHTDAPETTNIDPRFVTSTAEDFHLLPTSTLVGLGNSADVTTYPYDLEGSLRHVNPTLGCYESPAQHPVATSVGADGLERLLWADNNGQVSVWKLSAAGVKTSSSTFAAPNGFTPASLAVGTDNRVYVFLKSSTTSSVTVWTITTAGALASSKTYTPAVGWSFCSGAVSTDFALHLMWQNSHGTALFWEVSAGGVTTTRTAGPFVG